MNKFIKLINGDLINIDYIIEIFKNTKGEYRIHLHNNPIPREISKEEYEKIYKMLLLI